MDLTDYEATRRWGPAIKRAVLDRRMPPWRAAPGFGDFVNDSSLTPNELELIVAWVNGGMRVGPATELPPTPAPAVVPGTDRTDLLVAPPAGGRITSARRTFEKITQLGGDRWITGWEFRPDNLALVKHATFLVGDEVLGTWTPAEPVTLFPDGIGRRLAAGATLRVRIDYREPAEAIGDRSSLALRLTRQPVRAVQHIRLSRGLRHLPYGVDALAIRPLLAHSGDSVQVVVQRPDGSRDALLVVKKYDREMPVTYRFRRPVPLPAGTAVEVVSFAADSQVDLEFVRATPVQSGLTGTVKAATDTRPDR